MKKIQCYTTIITSSQTVDKIAYNYAYGLFKTIKDPFIVKQQLDYINDNWLIIRKSIICNLEHILYEEVAFDAQLITLLKVLGKRGRLMLLPYIYQAYKRIFHARIAPLVTLTTTIKLSEEVENELTSSLKQQLGDNITIKLEIDTSLGAGFKLKCNNLLLDLSAKTWISQILKPRAL